MGQESVHHSLWSWTTQEFKLWEAGSPGRATFGNKLPQSVTPATLPLVIRISDSISKISSYTQGFRYPIDFYEVFKSKLQKLYNYTSVLLVIYILCMLTQNSKTTRKRYLKQTSN